MKNPFVHVELNSPDPEKAKAFYGKLFQWQLEEMPNEAMPDHAYTVIIVGDGTGGGMMSDSDPKAPPYWLAYVGVDDIKASTEKAKKLGATIVQDVMQVGDFGWMSVIRDPTGAHLALWKANGKH